MCNHPVRIDMMDGKHYVGERIVNCRKCEECHKAKLRHWVGRVNAEMKHCKRIDFITATYGHNLQGHEKTLHYKDIQKMFKRLRKAGYAFKYIVVGEHGEKRGRAHWHLLIMWHSNPPAVEFDKNIHWEFWSDPDNKKPIGWIMFEKPRSTQGTAAYIMKYMQKEIAEHNAKRMRVSSGIGTKYILQRSREKARAGIRLFRYFQEYDIEPVEFTVEGNVNAQGQLFWYSVEGGSLLAQKMMDAYLEEWAILRPDQTLPVQQRAIERLEELMQEPITHPQLAVYAERHYGFNKGKFGVVYDTGEQKRITDKWRRDAEDRAILPNQVQIDMYRQLERKLALEKTDLNRPIKPWSKRKRPGPESRQKQQE